MSRSSGFSGAATTATRVVPGVRCGAATEASRGSAPGASTIAAKISWCTSVMARSPIVSSCPWRGVLSRAVPGEDVEPEVVLRVAPHAVHMVRVVLGVVELDQGDGTFDAEVVRLIDPVRPGPDEVQIVLAGGADPVHLPADLLRLEAKNEGLQEPVKSLALVGSHAPPCQSPALILDPAQRLSVQVGDSRVPTADTV